MMKTAKRKQRIANRKNQGRLIMRLVMLLALSLFAARYSLFAAFRDQGWGTRPSGMGGAFTAVSDDSNATAYNPAGLGQLESAEFSIMYAKPFVGLDLKAGTDGSTSLGMNYLSAVSPLGRWGSVGISWSNFNASQLYREDTYSLSYAKGLHEILWPSKDGDLFAGFTIKSMSTKFELDDLTRQTEATSSLSPFRNGTSASAVSADIGLLTRPVTPLRVGFAVRNVNSPDIGLQQEDNIPRELRTGAAWTTERLGPFEDLTSSVEYSLRKPKGNETDARTLFGVESWFNSRTYALRLGGNDREMSFGGSYSKSLRRFTLQLDYGFVWSTTIDENSGTHRLTLTIRQGAAHR